MSVRTVAAIACLSALVVTGCRAAGPMERTRMTDADGMAPSRSQWDAVAGTRIFFGHQSVGDNILDGIKTIGEAQSFPPLRIIESTETASVDGPMLLHAKIGQNGDPQSKIRGFQEALDAGFGQQVDVAFMKFCFWDVRRETDIDAVFADYQRTLADLAQRYPGVTFLHATVPFVAADVDWRARVRRLIGMTTPTDEDNAVRERLNQKLRDAYGPDHVFDIARAEEAHDGAEPRAQLASAYSSDGAHLNAAGRQRVGLALLRSLSDIQIRRLASR